MRLRKPRRKQDRPVERPVLQLPIIREPDPRPKKDDATEEDPRGVAVIDFFI
jgi:hypothetical protein